MSDAFKMLHEGPLYIKRNEELVKIATFFEGAILERTQDYGKWQKVQYRNQDGFIWKEATEEVSYQFNAPPVYGELLTIKETALYTNTHEDPVGIVMCSQKIPKVEKINSDWYMTYIAGRSFYVKSNQLLDLPYQFNIDEHKYYDVMMKYLIDSPYVVDNSRMLEIKAAESADLIIADKILFPRYLKDPIDFTNGINWEYAEGVNDANQNSFLRQLHALFFVNDLSTAYKETDNEVYIKKGYNIIMDWHENNPFDNPKHRMAWHDEGTARRLTVLINFFHSGKTVLTDQQKKDLFKIIVFHAHLLTEGSFYSANTNHGMFQDKALIIFSKYFYDIDGFQSYYELAVDRLNSYFNLFISKDGVHLEHSPSYHEVIAGYVKSVGTTILNFGDEDKASIFLNIYENMATYATHVIKPDGHWPLISDTYEVDNPPYSGIWEDNPEYQYAVSSGAVGGKPNETNMVFPEAGYAIFRDSWSNGVDGTYVFFIASYHTSYHKHSDDLSLWIYSNGEDIINESGPYSYLLTESTTKYAYSSYAHNTLIVDDEGLPRVDEKFEKTYMKEYNLTNEILPQATSVNERYDGVRQERTVKYDKTDQIIHVEDVIEGKENHNYKFLWHLAPEVIPTIDHDNNTIELVKNGNVIMNIGISGNPNLILSSVYGDEDPIYKSLQFQYNNKTKQLDKIKTHALIIEFNGKNGTVTTSFELE